MAKKSYTKRFKITKSGKILRKKAGRSHYNARERRERQLKRRRWIEFVLKPKTRQRYLD